MNKEYEEVITKKRATEREDRDKVRADILDKIKKILEEKQNIETSNNGKEEQELRAELQEINNNINSYSVDERFVYEERRNIIITDIARIEEEKKLKVRAIETNIKNVRTTLKKENEKISARIEELKKYSENLKISIQDQVKNLREESSKDFSKQDSEKIKNLASILDELKESNKLINEELMINIKVRNKNLSDLENLTYEKIDVFSDEVKIIEEKKTREKQAGENQTIENQTEENQTGENQTEENQTEENQIGENQTGENQTEEDRTEENQIGENQTGENQTEEERKGVLFDLEKAKKVKSILEEKIREISNKKREEHKLTDELGIIDYKYQDEKELRYNLEIDFYSRLKNIVTKYIEDEQFIKLITPNDKETLQNIEDVIANRDTNLEKLLKKQYDSIKREVENRGKKSLNELSKEEPIMKRSEDETLPIEKKESFWKRIGKKIPGIRRLFREKVIVKEDEEEENEENKEHEINNTLDEECTRLEQAYQDLCNKKWLSDDFWKGIVKDNKKFKENCDVCEMPENQKNRYYRIHNKWKSIIKEKSDIILIYKELCQKHKEGESFNEKNFEDSLNKLQNFMMNNKYYFSAEEFRKIQNNIQKFIVSKNENSHEQMQEQEQEMNPSSTGKHYVCSDIHGMYGSYMEAVSKLQDNDKLYILGDAIDRGKNGIKILQDIINRKGQIQYYLGNHDVTMIETIDCVNKYNLSNDDLQRIIKIGNKNRYGVIKSEDIPEELKKENIDSNISKEEISAITVWLGHNGGASTYNEYNKLSIEEKKEILEFLKNSPVMGRDDINNKKFLFVHAAPVKSVALLKSEGIYTYKILSECSKGNFDYNYLCEAREEYETNPGEFNKSFDYYKNEGFTIFCGHTPSIKVVDNRENHGYICVDTGCGHGDNLSVYSIEDERVMWKIPAKEDICISNKENEQVFTH